MRFDPKLIHAEDAPLDALGEIDLPDDLGELAAQLRDDATFLAERYPAKLPAMLIAETALAAEVLEPRRPASRRTLSAFAIAGLATALLIAATVIYRSIDEDSTATTAETSDTSSTLAALAPSLETVTPAAVLPTPPAGPRIQRLPWAPTSPAMGVTGPELEGLLDLWQNDEKPAETRISI